MENDTVRSLFSDHLIAVPKVELATPRIGFKLSRGLCCGPSFLNGPSYTFKALIVNKVYGLNATASCTRDAYRSNCSGRINECSCGFYAYNTRAQAAEMRLYSLSTYTLDTRSITRTSNAYRASFLSKILLMVSCSGMVIEHELGWRYEHQRVLSVEMWDYCCICLAPPINGWSPAHSLVPTLDYKLSPVCEAHTMADCLSVDEVSTTLGVPIHFETFPGL